MTREERLAEMRKMATEIATADYCHVADWGEVPLDYGGVGDEVLWLLSEVGRLENRRDRWKYLARSQRASLYMWEHSSCYCCRKSDGGCPDGCRCGVPALNGDTGEED